jgi:hypothetical protein
MKQRNPDARCENCPYWDWKEWAGDNPEPDLQDEDGYCLRHAPSILSCSIYERGDDAEEGKATILQGTLDIDERPMTHGYCSCGEHPEFFLPERDGTVRLGDAVFSADGSLAGHVVETNVSPTAEIIPIRLDAEPRT